MSTDEYTCSAASRERDEPMIGTAPEQATFLLIEAPGPWGRVALDTVDLPDGAAQAIEVLAKEHDAKVLLIRRPERVEPSADSAWVWGLADVGGGVRWGRWRSAGDLVVAGLGAPSSAPVVLVCTNGKRDVCCAVGGRQIVEALAADGFAEVWQCSHLGGHRFAPTFAVLPGGYLFGRVDDDRAPTVVREAAVGVIDWVHCRGRSGLPAPAQVAQAEAAARFDGPVQLVSVTGDGIRKEVHLRVADLSVTITVERVVDAPARMSCADLTAKAEPRYQVVGPLD